MKAETKSIILAALVGLVLSLLKLCGVLGISWLLALLPFWLPLAILVAIVGGGFLTVVGVASYVGFWGFIGRFMGKFFRRKG